MSNFSKYLCARDSMVDPDFNAQKFRAKYLKELDCQSWWDSEDKISLDFNNVKVLGSGFANEAFAYFGIYDITWNRFKEKVVLINISKVKLETIEMEVKSGTLES